MARNNSIVDQIKATQIQMARESQTLTERLKSHRAADRPEQTATVFATQLANMGYDRAIQDCYERTSKPNKISQIDIKDDRSIRTQANSKTGTRTS